MVSGDGEHNHATGPDVAAFYPEIRRLTETEESVVAQMVKSGAPARVIATSINAARRVEGIIGTVVPKDVFNKTNRIHSEKRVGKSERADFDRPSE